MYETLTTLRVEPDGPVVCITVNRPSRMNALNAVVKEELRGLMALLRDDAAVRAIVITGAGEKAFVAGTDIEELAGLDRERGLTFSQQGQALMNLIEQIGKPVIAAVNGYALGGGCELALACHLRLASDSAKFGMPEVNLGTIPGYGGTERLAKLVGRGKVLELMLTGRQIDAAESLRIGLVHAVLPASNLLSSAMELARGLAAKAPLAVRALLQVLVGGNAEAVSADMARESAQFAECCATGDFHEGVQAFLNKRPPVFRGS
jgi:enoyl-CoA hydratase